MQYAEFVEGLTYAKLEKCPLLEVFELAAPRVAEIRDLQRICDDAGIADAGIAFVVLSDPSCGEI